MQVTDIKKLYADAASMDGQRVRVCGWVRTVRAGKAFAFMEISDGTFFKTAQIVMEAELENYNGAQCRRSRICGGRCGLHARK